MMLRQSRKRTRHNRGVWAKDLNRNTENAADVPDTTSRFTNEGQPQAESPNTETIDWKTPVPTENVIMTTRTAIDLDSELESMSSISPSGSGINSTIHSECTSPKRTRQSSTPKRSMSPARFYRAREQSELQNLNDRLSSHLDVVKKLQAENSSLKLQLKGMEVFRVQAQSMKQYHNMDEDTPEEPLGNVKQENNRLKQTLQCTRKERDSLRQSLTAKEDDIVMMEVQLKAYKAVSEQFKKQETELKTMKELLKEKVGDVSRLTDELVAEKATRRRVEDDLGENKSRYMKEIEETNMRMNEHIETTDQKLEAGYEKLVSDALSGVREHNVRELAAVKEEFATIYQNKVVEWKNKAERSNADLLYARKELKAVKTESEGLHTQLTRVKMDFAGLKVQLEEEQAKYRKLRDDSEKESGQMLRETVLLKQELAEVKEELEEMGGANMRFEQEIKQYRVLLEDFETKSMLTKRLKTPMTQGNTGKSKRGEANSSRNIKDCSVPPTTYFRTNQVDHGLRIEMVDSNGRYLTIVNTTDHLVDMCLWVVKQSTINKKIAYEIPCNTPLMPEQRLIVWSQGEGPFVNKPNSDELLSFPDDIENREFYSMSLGEDNNERDKKPTIDAIHINMLGKRWLSGPFFMNVRLEDGDGQLQSKSDFIVSKDGANVMPRTPPQHGEVSDGRKKSKRAVKSRGRTRKRGIRSQSVNILDRVPIIEHGTDDEMEQDGGELCRISGPRMQTDKDGRLNKDGCVMM